MMKSESLNSNKSGLRMIERENRVAVKMNLVDPNNHQALIPHFLLLIALNTRANECGYDIIHWL